MKAYVRIDPVNQEVRLEEVPVPEIANDEVLIRVEAFGVGIHDRYFIPSDVHFPYIIGSEGAGIISETGSDVTDFAINDRVIFTTVLQRKGGTWADYAVANHSSLVPLPGNLSFAEGAAIPIAGKTALESMRELALNAGEKLFIAGASGAIGSLVIQLAVAKGIEVSASASAKNQEFMKSLGAAKTVDYNDPDWESKIWDWSKGGVDAALAIQPGTGIKAIHVVRDGGTVITVSGDNAKIVPERKINIRQMGHGFKTQAEMLQLVNRIANGKIRLIIEKEYPFHEALKALEKTETRHARGKVIVKGKE